MLKKPVILIAFLLVGVALTGSCKGAEPAVVKNGDTVKVHYTGTLDDGTVFDSSKERGPLEFIAGNGDVISGFDKAVLGMRVGETKTVHFPVDEAYGPPRSDLIITIPRTQVPPGTQVGSHLQQEGSAVDWLVTAVTDTEVTLDANHPLAGKDLNFEITVVEIIPPAK